MTELTIFFASLIGAIYGLIAVMVCNKLIGGCGTTEKQEYIMKNGVLFKWVDAYRKGGVYIACNQPYHYLELGISGDVYD